MLLSKFISKEISKNRNSKNINLLLSGGKSVKNVYRLISKADIQWQNVDLSLIDERLTSVEKSLNINNIKNIFKKKIIEEKRILNLREIYNKKKIKLLVNKFKKNKPILIAGFGKDGHFASIFRESLHLKKLINLKNKPNLIKTEKLGSPYVSRITMNMSFMLMSKIIIIIVNKGKLNILKKYLNKEDKRNYPITFLIKKAKKKLLIYDGKKLIKISALTKLR